MNSGVKVNNKLWIIFILIAFVSCSNEVEDIINGSSWDKRKIFINGYDAFFCFYYSGISFDRDGTMILMDNNNLEGCDTLDSPARRGKWEIYQKKDKKYYLKITSKQNSVFTGEHRIIFYKDTVNRLLYLNLRSENFYYLGAKFLFNYNININKVNKLIQLTQDSLDPNNQLNGLK